MLVCLSLLLVTMLCCILEEEETAAAASDVNESEKRIGEVVHCKSSMELFFLLILSKLMPINDLVCSLCVTHAYGCYFSLKFTDTRG